MTPRAHKAALLKRRKRMLEYLKLKVEEQDHHGVADAAMDLRDIDAALLTLKLLGLR